MSEQSCTVPGKPMTWARARTGRGRYFTDPVRERRMGDIAGYWQETGHPKIQRGEALALRCEFIFDRPDGHFGTGRNVAKLKERFRHTRPGRGKLGGDLDNLVKLVKDSLNTVAYADDSQIAELQALKRYTEPGEVTETRITLLPLVTGGELPEAEDPSTQLDLAGNGQPERAATSGVGWPE
jgi:Holliday junction resolvase RusA-like endonuclease